MNKLRLIYFALIVLVICNVGVLAYLFHSNTGKPHGKTEPKHVIIKKLQLTPDQIQDYEQLIEKHQQETKEYANAIQQSKHALYTTLTTQNNTQKDSLLKVISQSQFAIEQIHYKHFQSIQALCTSEQLHYFDQLTPELAQLFRHPPRKKHD